MTERGVCAAAAADRPCAECPTVEPVIDVAAVAAAPFEIASIRPLGHTEVAVVARGEG
jgi:hypothetical protein